MILTFFSRSHILTAYTQTTSNRLTGSWCDAAIVLQIRRSLPGLVDIQQLR